MQSIFRFMAVGGAVTFAAVGNAFAAGPSLVPEPGSLALVGVAVAALVLVGRRKK